jgi:predicted phosphodiesterase
LDFLEHNFETVVLLGDIWETLTPRFPGQFSPAFAAAQAAHPEIARRFRKPCYKYIHGNHDLIAARHGAPLAMRLTVDGKRIFFTHGHLYDALIRRARYISELGVFLGGWLCRLGCYPVYRAFNRLDTWVSGHTVGIADKPVREASGFHRFAFSNARAQRADIIVTGHTHVAQALQSDGTLFLNSGSCTRGKYSFLTLDTHCDDYRVATNW